MLTKNIQRILKLFRLNIGLTRSLSALVAFFCLIAIISTETAFAEPAKDSGQKNFLRFRDNGDNTINDMKTGLQWLKDANIRGRVPWQFAVKYINDMNAGTIQNYGFKDWRLPTIRELSSLFEKGKFYPAIPSGNPFDNVQNDFYWSSTGGFNVVGYVWTGDMSTGSIKYDYVSFCNFLYFWPVRGKSNVAELAQPRTEEGVAGQDLDFSLRGGAGVCKDKGSVRPPLPPSVITATAISASEVVISWEVPESSDDVAWYNIYEDNVLVKSEPTLSTRIKGLDTNSRHCYDITSLGSSGVESQRSRQECITTWGSSAKGTVWSVGVNDYGQLGDGTNESKGQLVTASSLSDVIDISSGVEHSIALKSDGTVWSWGKNLKGQLGDGTTKDSLVPVKVKGLSDVVSVSAGWYHSVALKKDGTVWSWGRNYYGQLGNGGNVDSTVPVRAQDISDIIQVAAGWYHTLALKKDGRVYAWGWNLKGQTGLSDKDRSSLPVQVSGIADVTKIAAGMYHSLALMKGGQVVAWGWNEFGQLGDNLSMDSYTPVRVSGLTDIINISGGMHHSLALKADGTVWGWGRNDYGQINLPDLTQSSIPIQIPGLALKAVSISSGAHHSAAIMDDGSLWTWGWLYGGKQTIASPQKKSGLEGFVKVSSGLNFTTVIK